DFAVPTLLEVVGRGHEVVGVYTRAPKPGGRRGLDLTPSPIEREARRFALPVFAPATLRTTDAAGSVRALGADVAGGWVPWGARRGCGGCRGLWIDPAAADPRSLSVGCVQSACLASAALARRRADQPCDHGGRCGDRRDGDENGGGARRRPDCDGGTRADHL